MKEALTPDEQQMRRALDLARAGVGLVSPNPAVGAVVIDSTGNTSSASIPLALVAAIEQGRLSPGDLVLFAGFGAGMSWSSVVWRWGV